MPNLNYSPSEAPTRQNPSSAINCIQYSTVNDPLYNVYIVVYFDYTGLV
jgi:hypothetical protein